MSSTPNDLEQARALLYAEPPERFIAARTELAKRLTTEGAKALAKDVKGIHKPVLAVWMVNRLAHEATEKLREFVELASVLQRLQRLPGQDVAAFRETGVRLRAKKGELVAAALEAAGRVGEKASDALERKVIELLDGIAVDADARRVVLLGAFTGETADPFAALLGAGPAPVVAEAPTAKILTLVPPVPPAPREDEGRAEVERRRAEEQRADEQRRLEEEKREGEERRLADERRRAEEERRRRRTALEAALRQAEERAARLAQQAHDAEERAKEARLQATKADEEATRARQALEAHDAGA